MEASSSSLNSGEGKEIQPTSFEEDEHAVTSYPPLIKPPSSKLPFLVLKKKQRRIGWHLLASTVAIFALSAGFAVILLLWVTSLHGLPAETGESITQSVQRTGIFLVDEGTVVGLDGIRTARLRVLTLSSVATQVVSATAPLLVMMTAYCTAGEWLTQRLSADGKGLPTPAQYADLAESYLDDRLKDCLDLGYSSSKSSTSGLVAMYETARYLVVYRHQKKRESVPRLFYMSTISVVVIYAITHLISAADLWLHVSSSAILWNMTLPVEYFDGFEDMLIHPLASNPGLFGFAFNDTLCDGANNPSSCFSYYPTISSIATAGTLIAENTSIAGNIPNNQPNPRYPLSVITLHDEDDLAIITPTIDPSTNLSSWSWTAPTYGIRASCTVTGNQCAINSLRTSFWAWNCTYPGFGNTVEFGAVAPPSGIGMDLNDTFTFSPTNTSNPITPVQLPNPSSYFIQGNPYNISLYMGWSLALEGSKSNLVDGNGNGFAQCQIECFNLTIKYDGGGGYSVVNGTMETASPQFAAVMSGAFFTGTAVGLALQNLAPLVLTGLDNTQSPAAINQQFSRIALAGFAGAVIPQPPNSLSQQLALSQYRAAPLITYASLLFLYSIVVLIIFVRASLIKSPVVRARNGTETQSLKLGQNLLTDSVMLVGLALPQALHGLDEDVLLKEPIDLFGEVAEENDGAGAMEKEGLRRRAPRLLLDVVDEGPRAGMIFGVREWKLED